MEERFVLNDEWLVEPKLYRLTGPSGTHQVEPKVMGVLLALRGAQGEPVSAEQLLEEVWQTTHVAQEVVRRAIYELRRTLQEDADAPRFIETIPRAGYRLVASISAPDERPLTRSFDWKLPAAATAILLVVVISGVLQPRHERHRHRVLPLTSEPGIEAEPCFSPEGGRIAFVKRTRASERELQVQIIGEPSQLRLAAGAHRPCWSADGGSVIFLRSVNSGDERTWELVKVPALGGAESRLAVLGSMKPAGLACARDLASVVVAWAPDSRGPTALWLFDLEKGSRSRLTTPPPTSQGDRDPSWSPDGEQIAFLRTLRPGVDKARLVEASSRSERGLSDSYRDLRDIAWTPGGKTLVVADGTHSEHALLTVPLDGKPFEWLAAADGAVEIAADPRHGRLALTQRRTRHRFVTASPSQSELLTVDALSSTRRDLEPSLSADGQRVAFVSTRSGAREIWIAAFDGSWSRRLTNFRGPFVGEPAWSPNQLWVAFSSTASGDPDIWRVDARGGLPEQLTFATSNELNPSFSSDGSQLFFASDRSGRWEIWRRALEPEGEPPLQVTQGGGFRAMESADGRWLYYSHRRQPGLWRLAAGSKEPEPIFAELPGSDTSFWVLRPSGLFFSRAGEGIHFELVFTDFSGAPTKPVAHLRAAARPQLTVGGEDDRILAIEPFEVESDLVLLEDLWPES